MVPRRRAARSAQPPADQPVARPVAHHAVSAVWIAPPDPGAFIVDPEDCLRSRRDPSRPHGRDSPTAAEPQGADPPVTTPSNPAPLPPAATPISGRSVPASPPSNRSPLKQIFGDLAHPGGWVLVLSYVSHCIADHEWRCCPLHKDAQRQLAHIGMTEHRQPAPSCRSARDGDYGATFGSASRRDWALNRWGSGHDPLQPGHSRRERRAVVITGVVAVWRVATSRWVLRRRSYGRGGRR